MAAISNPTALAATVFGGNDQNTPDDSKTRQEVSQGQSNSIGDVWDRDISRVQSAEAERQQKALELYKQGIDYTNPMYSNSYSLMQQKQNDIVRMTEMSKQQKDDYDKLLQKINGASTTTIDMRGTLANLDKYAKMSIEERAKQGTAWILSKAPLDINSYESGYWSNVIARGMDSTTNSGPTKTGNIYTSSHSFLSQERKKQAAEDIFSGEDGREYWQHLTAKIQGMNLTQQKELEQEATQNGYNSPQAYIAAMRGSKYAPDVKSSSLTKTSIGQQREDDRSKVRWLLDQIGYFGGNPNNSSWMTLDNDENIQETPLYQQMTASGIDPNNALNQIKQKYPSTQGWKFTNLLSGTKAGVFATTDEGKTSYSTMGGVLYNEVDNKYYLLKVIPKKTIKRSQQINLQNAFSGYSQTSTVSPEFKTELVPINDWGNDFAIPYLTSNFTGRASLVEDFWDVAKNEYGVVAEDGKINAKAIYARGKNRDNNFVPQNFE